MVAAIQYCTTATFFCTTGKYFTQIVGQARGSPTGQRRYVIISQRKGENGPPQPQLSYLSRQRKRPRNELNKVKKPSRDCLRVSRPLHKCQTKNVHGSADLDEYNSRRQIIIAGSVVRVADPAHAAPLQASHRLFLSPGLQCNTGNVSSLVSLEVSLRA